MDLLKIIFNWIARNRPEYPLEIKEYKDIHIKLNQAETYLNSFEKKTKLLEKQLEEKTIANEILFKIHELTLKEKKEISDSYFAFEHKERKLEQQIKDLTGQLGSKDKLYAESNEEKQKLIDDISYLKKELNEVTPKMNEYRIKIQALESRLNPSQSYSAEENNSIRFLISNSAIIDYKWNIFCAGEEFLRNTHSKIGRKLFEFLTKRNEQNQVQENLEKQKAFLERVTVKSNIFGNEKVYLKHLPTPKLDNIYFVTAYTEKECSKRKDLQQEIANKLLADINSKIAEISKK